VVDGFYEKLTAEVFNRPECPEWACYAVVDIDGNGWYFEQQPIRMSEGRWTSAYQCRRQVITCAVFDAEDWQNSLIKRPSKLPEWAEVGGHVYDDRNGYGKIVSGSVKSCYIEFDGGAGDFVPEAFAELKQARLRPWTFEEAPEYLKVKDKGGNDYIIGLMSHDVHHWGYFMQGPCTKPCGVFVTLDKIAENYTQLDGSPCGVLEHLEDGEWVE
jgi:hypothetical protein